MAAAQAQGVKGRKSGRDAGELRQITCERGLLNRADGSARWSQDQTSVIAAVWGPRQGRNRRQEDPQRANIDVVFKPKVGMQGSLEHEYERVIRQTLEAVVIRAAHPRCVIQVVLQVAQDDGGVLAAAINAACAALVDAGVPMNAQVAAVSLAVIDSLGVVVDSDRADETAARAVATLAFPSRGAVDGGRGGGAEGGGGGGEVGALASFTKGAMGMDEYLACMEMGQAGAEGVSSFSRLSLQRYQRGAEMSAQ